MIRRLLRFITSWLHPHLLFDHDGSARFLTRFFVFGGPRDWGEFGQPYRRTRWWIPFNVMLQRTHRSDESGVLHNHPWKWCLSLVLAGGYTEERRVPVRCPCGYARCDHQAFTIQKRLVRPWRVNFVRADDFHRTDLLQADSWSFVIAGPRVQDWGFWHVVSHVFMYWRDYLRAETDGYWSALTLHHAARRHAEREGR